MCCARRTWAAFVKLTSEKIALRTAHSPLVGYWNVEFGQLNSVVHLWQYDSLAHRAKVRAALGSDAVWNGEYMNVVKPMWQSQSNTLAASVVRQPRGCWRRHRPGRTRCAICKALVCNNNAVIRR
jgi:hypothetical protein